MGLTTTAADAVLKEDYKGPVREQLNNMSVVMANVMKNTEDISGRRAVLALHVGRNSGVGARGERQPLPAAGAQQYEDVYIPLRSNYARIELTGQTLKVMAKDRGAFIRALRPEMEGAVEDAKRDVARQVWGTSDGRIAETGATAASTTVELDAPSVTQLGQLEEGFLIDIGTLADPDSVAAGREVLSVGDTNIVISGAAVTTTTAHSIFRAGAGGASDNSGRMNDGQIELTGLQHIVDDDSILHTLDPAAEPRWKAQVYENDPAGTGRNISENLLQTALMTSERRTGRVAKLLVGSDGVFRAYGNLLTSLKRFNDTTQLRGGFTGVKIGTASMGGNKGQEQSLTWDRDAPSNSLYGLDLENIQFYQLAEWDWMDEDGAVLNRVSGYDAYEATMFTYGDLGCSRRNSQFVIRDVNES